MGNEVEAECGTCACWSCCRLLWDAEVTEELGCVIDTGVVSTLFVVLGRVVSDVLVSVGVFSAEGLSSTFTDLGGGGEEKPSVLSVVVVVVWLVLPGAGCCCCGCCCGGGAVVGA